MHTFSPEYFQLRERFKEYPRLLKVFLRKASDSKYTATHLWWIYYKWERKFPDQTSPYYWQRENSPIEHEKLFKTPEELFEIALECLRLSNEYPYNSYVQEWEMHDLEEAMTDGELHV